MHAFRFFVTVLGLSLCASAFANAQVPDAAAQTLKEHIRRSAPAGVSRQRAIDLAEARRASAGLSSAVVLSTELEEVPQFANVANASSIRVDASRELVPGGLRKAARDLASRDVDRAVAEAEIASRLLDADVDRLLTTAAGNAAIVARLASEDSLLRSAEEALRSRFGVGDARYVDVLRLRAERLRIETALSTNRGRSRSARRQLVLMASYRDSSVGTRIVDEAIRESTRTLGESVRTIPSIDSLVRESGAMRLAAIALDRAKAAQLLATAELRGTLTPSVGLQRFTGENGSKSIGLTAGVSFPLGFTSRKANTARLLTSRQAVALAESEQVTVETEVRLNVLSALERFETARTQVATFNNALLLGAREEREAALASYRSGGLSLIELLDFERALAQAEIARIRNRIEVAVALLDLLEASLGVKPRSQVEDNGDDR